MQKDLKDLVDVVVNNDYCVVLKVKDDCRMDLIALGCFCGDEEMLRLTKGRTQECTVFLKNGEHFSWHWGYGGYTLVSDKTKEKGRMIQDTIEKAFGISIKK